MSNVSLGQAHETELKLREAGATIENFWGPIAQSKDLARRVVAFVAAATRVVFTIANIERNKNDWKCLEPVNAEEGDFEPSLHEFLKEGENYTGGEEMLKRAEKKGIYSGLRHLEAMLREQERIPVEWRGYLLVSTEVWQSPFGNRSVRHLYCYCEHWYLSYVSLCHDFDSRYRLVAPRKYQK